MRSTRANSSGPPCSAMTCPSSEPRSRTSRRSGSLARASPGPGGSALTAGNRVGDAVARAAVERGERAGIGQGCRGAARLSPGGGLRFDCKGTVPVPARNRRRGRRRLRLPSQPAHREGATLIGTRPLRILVVDDDPAMVGAITALVGTEGHQVITAYDGLTAVKRYREERPDLVLLDLAMPGPDGFTVIGQLRSSGNVPVLVVSGESAEAAKVKALGIGADDYLVKPFGKQELLARISAVMRRVDLAGTGRMGVPGDGAPGVLTAGSLTLEPARHEARVGAMPLGLTPTEFRLLEALVRAGGDLVAHHRLPRAGRAPHPAPPPPPRRPRRARSGPAVAQAAPRAPPREARGRRWAADRGRPLGWLPHRG